MSVVLSVEQLCKEYPGFRLDNVSFQIQQGSIMGFIGRNGAGKTTTLKSILNLVHPSRGIIKYWDMDFYQHEGEIKQRIGFAAGAVGYYKKKKISEIVRVTQLFFDNWDPVAYAHYMKLFSIDPNKTPEALSEGMKVKFNLVLALSHRAELLILDEPTTGLDPVSRDELLDVFLHLAKEGKSILFSTHITSDLDKCADYITYIQNGRIRASQQTDAFIEAYRVVSSEGTSGTDNAQAVNGALNAAQQQAILGECLSRKGNTYLIAKDSADLFPGCPVSTPSLEEIMIHFEKEVHHE